MSVNNRVRTFGASDLTVVGPATADLGPAGTVGLVLGDTANYAMTPVVPATAAGLTPGSPGSGSTLSPAMYVVVKGDSNVATIYRLTQTGSSTTLTADPGASLTAFGKPGPSIATSEVAGGPLGQGRRHDRERPERAEHVHRHHARDEVAGSFLRTAPAISGGFVYAVDDAGAQHVVDLSSGASVQDPTPGAGAGLGGPAISRGFVVFPRAGGLVVYRGTDIANPDRGPHGPGGRRHDRGLGEPHRTRRG